MTDSDRSAVCVDISLTIVTNMISLVIHFDSASVGNISGGLKKHREKKLVIASYPIHMGITTTIIHNFGVILGPSWDHLGVILGITIGIPLPRNIYLFLLNLNSFSPKIKMIESRSDYCVVRKDY